MDSVLAATTILLMYGKQRHLGTGPANQINNEDAIAEVSLQTGLFSAEFGRAAWLFNLITKSGTNDYHGTCDG